MMITIICSKLEDGRDVSTRDVSIYLGGIETPPPVWILGCGYDTTNIFIHGPGVGRLFRTPNPLI